MSCANPTEINRKGRMRTNLKAFFTDIRFFLLSLKIRPDLDASCPEKEEILIKMALVLETNEDAGRTSEMRTKPVIQSASSFSDTEFVVKSPTSC